MKEIRITYVPRLNTYEYQLVRVTPSGKVFPMTAWVAGGRTVEAAKTSALARFGELTISVN